MANSAKNTKDSNDNQSESSIEEMTKQLVSSITKMDYKRLINEVQKQDEAISIAKENKRAAYAKLVNKGASRKALQQIVAFQDEPEPANKLVQATLRAYEETTGQKDFFKK